MNSPRFHFSGLIFAVLCVSATSVCRSEDVSPAEPLPDHAETVLKWLPADTETLVVYTKPKQMTKQSALNLGKMLVKSPVLEELDDLTRHQTIAWGVYGGRNFRIVSAFGTLVQEGASVIRFTESFSAEKLAEIQQGLRVQAERTNRIADREVFVFPFSRKGVEGYYKERPWDGVYVVMLDDRTIVRASSDRYLREMLKRIDTPEPNRALPKELPEWKYVDTSATVWLLRHLPTPADATKRRSHLQGVVWRMDQNKLFQATYLPVKGTSVDDIARRPWVDQETKSIAEDLKTFLSFEEFDDGAVTVTLGSFGGATKEKRREMAEQLNKSPHKAKIAVFAMFYLYTSQGMTQ